ncbi:glycerophosphodiester phosphodiesterase family protein [Arcanobacterium hippocoleae]
MKFWKSRRRTPALDERIWKIAEKPIVLAHRAGGNEAPENSLSAFAKMQKLGFRYIETDSQATKDGVVILFTIRFWIEPQTGMEKFPAIRGKSFAKYTTNPETLRCV